MTRKIIFSPEARLEFEEAVRWYNQQHSGLGFRFEAEVHETLEGTLQRPERFRLISKNIHVARLKVFAKYAIYFHVEPGFIGVVAIFHASRNPDDLRRRLG